MPSPRSAPRERPKRRRFPPDPEARAKLPPAFKDKFGIELEYLGGNSSQLASRIESERNAGQYTMDASLSGSDSMIETFYKNKWLDPLKLRSITPDPLGGELLQSFRANVAALQPKLASPAQQLAEYAAKRRVLF